jgi:hypothetical protein
MTAGAQFCCILASAQGCDTSPRESTGERPAAEPAGDPKDHAHGTADVRETTRSRSHDPTAQPKR